MITMTKFSANRNAVSGFTGYFPVDQEVEDSNCVYNNCYFCTAGGYISIIVWIFTTFVHINDDFWFKNFVEE